MKLNPRHTKRAAAIGAAITLTAGLAACSDGGSEDQPADNQAYKIVASTPIWGDIAEEVISSSEGADKKFEVVTIMTNRDDDPHEYEATASDLAKASDADIVAANGAGYDNWLTDNAGDAPIVSALPLAEAHTHDHDDEGHDHDHDADEHGEDAHEHDADDHEHEHGEEGHDHSGQNPHAWFDMDIVNAFADSLAAQLHKLDGDFPGTLDSDSGIKKKTAEFTKRFKELPAHKVLLTEPVAEPLVEKSTLEDVTPESYAKTVAREAEPSAADLAAAKKLITDGGVDVLITNEQSETPSAEQLKKAAEDKKVAIVNINETPAEGKTYFDYVDDAISQLEKA